MSPAASVRRSDSHGYDLSAAIVVWMLVAALTWKIPLAGDAFRALGSPISHRGDRGAACHEGPESGGENPGRTKGFYRAEEWGCEGCPIGR